MENACYELELCYGKYFFFATIMIPTCSYQKLRGMHPTYKNFILRPMSHLGVCTVEEVTMKEKTSPVDIGTANFFFVHGQKPLWLIYKKKLSRTLVPSHGVIKVIKAKNIKFSKFFKFTTSKA